MWEQIEEVCPDAPGAVFDKDVCMQLVDRRVAESDQIPSTRMLQMDDKLHSFCA